MGINLTYTTFSYPPTATDHQQRLLEELLSGQCQLLIGQVDIKDTIHQMLVMKNQWQGVVNELYSGVQLMLHHQVRLVEMLEGLSVANSMDYVLEVVYTMERTLHLIGTSLGLS